MCNEFFKHIRDMLKEINEEKIFSIPQHKLQDDISERITDLAGSLNTYYKQSYDYIEKYDKEVSNHDLDIFGNTYKLSEFNNHAIDLGTRICNIMINEAYNEVMDLLNTLRESLESELDELGIDDYSSDDFRMNINTHGILGYFVHNREKDLKNGISASYWLSNQCDGLNAVQVGKKDIYLEYPFSKKIENPNLED